MSMRVWLSRSLSAIGLLVAFGLPASADAPYSFDRAFGRLPKNVRPLDYRITIVPDAAARKLTGTESVVLEVRRATATIQFNSLNITLRDVRFDGRPVERTVTSNARQLTTVTLSAAAPPGRHVLAFAYRGQIETAPQGLFAQPYVKPDGGHGLLLSTQFESTDARRMFPCWDEPAFRATFELSATIPASLVSVSNMPIVSRTVRGGLATTTFARTPPMPAYLLEYSAGDLARIGAVRDGTAFNVWAVKGQEDGGRVALANAEQILADYNDYFGFRYPLPKLDSIAVPGGFQGAMENWGAITYNDLALLVTPASTIGDIQTIYSIQAHEMAHQWNGDLVTMGWWDDLWLNESFASWRSAKETDARNPSWHWWEGQDADKESAMTADARLTSHPVRVHIADELQAETAGDSEITYSKGQAFLRMLEAYLTPDVFRAGIRRYIKARAYSNATSADLWIALGKASGKDVGRLSAAWIERAGFPLVSVTALCAANGARTIALRQKRFLLEGTDPAHTTWVVPLNVRAGIQGPVSGVLFTHAGQTVRAGRCGEPLTINAGGAGFYRVSYDQATSDANAAAFGHLPDSDRITLLDDQWALGASGQAPLVSYLRLARAMGDDLDARAWQQITGSLDTIEFDERGTSGHAAFVTFARALVAPVYARLGWDAKPDEPPGLRELRRTVLLELGSWGDPAVVAGARERFTAFLADRRAIAADDQETILSIIALNADAATFDQLHALASSATGEAEQRRYFTVLMRVRDDDLAKRARDIALSKEIPAQAETLRFSLIATLATEHPALAWETFKANSTMLLDPFGPLEAPTILAQYVPRSLWFIAPLDQIDAFIKPRIAKDFAPALARGMESARFSLHQKSLLDAAVDAYLPQ